MKLHKEEEWDVLVVGLGLAGITAAIAAAEEGSRVCLVGGTVLFSGSGFYPGTWGLGLIEPESDTDKDDLEETICRVGQGMIDRELVKTFVDNIPAAINDLSQKGVKLREPRREGEREYIPCFDHKHRKWHGLEKQSLKETYGKLLHNLSIKVYERHKIVDLIKKQGRVCGAVFLTPEGVRYLGCKTLILATGGYAGLFKHHLSCSDTAGIGQALALEAGCRLVNMEFMQMMPGFLSPAYQMVFNEKTFRFTKMYSAINKRLFSDKEGEEILDLRSTYGPFTSELASRTIDFEIYDHYRRTGEGIRIVYRQDMLSQMPEFVQTYFDWLKETCGLTIKDTIQVGMFAHAANGGIYIQKNGETDIKGLYACGEVTGGMHGADRIGGLSSANALVFGRIAGKEASLFSKESDSCSPNVWEVETQMMEADSEVKEELSDIMTEHAMIVRSEHGLSEGIQKLTLLKERHSGQKDIQNAILTAESILTAQKMRRESRGSHFREDYPEKRETEETLQMISMRKNNTLQVQREVRA